MTFDSLKGQKFGVIAIDPPWKFKAGHSNRSTENHYPTMAIAEIKALDIKSLAAPDCAMFMWTTPPFLALSIDVMRAWRFRYVSIAFTWVKLRKGHRDALFLDGDMFVGLGHTTRKSTEICLLGKRGKPKRLAKNVKEIIFAARREHSRKPEESARRMEMLYPGPFLEIFARTTRPGWVAWGNDTERFK